MRSAAPRHEYTFRDYLDVEESSVVRHEFLRGEIYAMAGGTPEHAALCAALIGQLVDATRGTPCRTCSSDLRVRIQKTGLATYPDAAIVCGDEQRDPESPTHVINPLVLFEVLSPGTEQYDRGEKREHYQQIETLREYVVIAQDRRHAEVWRRTGPANEWHHEIADGGSNVRLESIDRQLDLDALCAGAGLSLP